MAVSHTRRMLLCCAWQRLPTGPNPHKRQHARPFRPVCRTGGGCVDQASATHSPTPAALPAKHQHVCAMARPLVTYRMGRPAPGAPCPPSPRPRPGRSRTTPALWPTTEPSARPPRPPPPRPLASPPRPAGCCCRRPQTTTRRTRGGGSGTATAARRRPRPGLSAWRQPPSPAPPPRRHQLP